MLDLGPEDLPVLTKAQLLQAHRAAERNGTTTLAGLLERYANRTAPLSVGESSTIRRAIQLCGQRQPIAEE